MSLIKTHWVVLASAAALAVATPYQLLRSRSEPTQMPSDFSATQIALATVPNYDAAFSAPLFSADRAPAGTSDPTLAIAAGSAPTVAPPPLPRLVGIALAQRGKGVVLVKQADGQTRTLYPGDEADGWRLVGMTRSSAKFRAGHATQTLTLDFGNKPSASASATSGPILLPPSLNPALTLPERAGPQPSDPTGTFR